MDDQGRKGAFTKDKATIKKDLFSFQLECFSARSFFPPKTVGVSGLGRPACI